MTAASVELRPWPWRHRLGVVALILIGQLALIFWLGSTTPIRPRVPTSALTLRFAGRGSAEMRALEDPTLFTLPRLPESSVAMTTRTPPPETQSFEALASTNPLPLALDQLSDVFSRVIETNHFDPLAFTLQPDAARTLPKLIPLSLPPPRSVVDLEGGLSGRRLLTPLDLKPQPSTEILASTVLLVGVDAEGLPVSVALLSGSGSAAADQYGLEQARNVRFEPDPHTSAGVTDHPMGQTSWGKMIFRWYTVPEQPAATPAVSP